MKLASYLLRQDKRLRLALDSRKLHHTVSSESQSSYPKSQGAALGALFGESGDDELFGSPQPEPQITGSDLEVMTVTTLSDPQ